MCRMCGSITHTICMQCRDREIERSPSRKSEKGGQKFAYVKSAIHTVYTEYTSQYGHGRRE